MKYQTQFFLAALLSVASATPARRHIVKREVPQEHSHEIYLTIVREFLNAGENPLGIQDPVFGFLGNAAAAAGVEADINLDCLKQFTADQAFTNAKALGDVRGMAAALVLQALERNTAGVGVKSVICPEEAVNPEIAAFDQHQDPASEDAAAINKAITLELAKQLALIGVDPLLALESGTFPPGDLNDPTGAGNSCDDLDDPIGCIFTQNLLVLDATPEEVLAAVEGIEPTFTGTGVIEATNINFEGIQVADGGDVVIQTADAPAAEETEAPCTIFVTKGAAAETCSTTTTTAPAAENTGAADEEGATAAGINIQEFTGTLGGPPPPVISSASDRPFSVNGATFIGANAALSRSCDIQKNACANAANSGALDGGVAQCEAQVADCKAANALKLRKRKAMASLKKRAPKTTTRVIKRITTTVHKRQASAFGSCSDPTIQFGVGFDGRREGSFAPVNNADFNHGSAQRIGIISSFICQRLRDSCKADEAVVATCDEASQAAQAATQDETAADTFNQILVAGAAAPAGAAADVEEEVVADVVEIVECS